MPLTRQRRLRLYLQSAEQAISEIAKNGSPSEAFLSQVEKTTGEGPFIGFTKDEPIGGLLARLGRRPKKTEGIITQDLLGFAFLAPVILWLHENSSQSHVLVRYGDSAKPLRFPALIKVRRISHPGAGVLAPLQWKRHFQPLYDIQSADLPWSQKADSLVWRGATTGRPKHSVLGQSRAWISDLAARAQSDPRIDVGFNRVSTKPGRWPIDDNAERFMKPSLPLKEQLKSKYLLSIEGNDVATGLKWMMGSRSCVLMPTPIVESWFCESLLEPWEHYVPVRRDLGDVEEKLSWCQSHDKEAEAIGENGRQFAETFINTKTEDEIFHEVMSWWSSNRIIQQIAQRLKN